MPILDIAGYELVNTSDVLGLCFSSLISFSPKRWNTRYFINLGLFEPPRTVVELNFLCNQILSSVGLQII